MFGGEGMQTSKGAVPVDLQGNSTGQEVILQATVDLVDPVTWMDYFKDKPVVGSAAGPVVGIAVDDPHFRLPTQDGGVPGRL